MIIELGTYPQTIYQNILIIRLSTYLTLILGVGIIVEDFFLYFLVAILYLFRVFEVLPTSRYLPTRSRINISKRE